MSLASNSTSSTTGAKNTAPDIETFHGSSLELQNLTMAYGDIEVLRNVSLTVAPGTTTCIIGPSGSGKSTLLRGVNRLHEPKSGDVLLAGESALGVKPDILRPASAWSSSTSTSSRTTPPSKTSPWPSGASRACPRPKPGNARPAASPR